VSSRIRPCPSAAPSRAVWGVSADQTASRHTHTHTHAHAHALTGTHTYTHTHIQTHTHTRTHTQAFVNIKAIGIRVL
jgi:hypothetical protein